MLSRRKFAGVVGCFLCEVTRSGFMATGVSAQQPAATTGVTRKILSQVDGPMPGYVTIMVEVTIEANAVIGRHTHPGIEAGYVVDGELTLPIAGQPDKVLKSGDVFEVPPNTAHAGAPNGPRKSTIISTYVVEKDKPLATPA